MTVIDDYYQSLGGASSFLGTPQTPEQMAFDGGSCRHYAGGSIYWHRLTDAHEVHGLIRDKWAELGWERSFLGYPKSEERNSVDASGRAIGRFNLFQGGAILWKNGASEAFENHGAIRDKFGKMGWEAGFLGFPTTDETKTDPFFTALGTMYAGRYNHFENGSIFWKPSISAHELHGLIRDYWGSQGWEQSTLGYPISDELPANRTGDDRFSDFENGVVYWKDQEALATPLSKMVIASRTSSDMLQAFSAAIDPRLTANALVYIQNGPSLAAITDYTWNGARVLNRQYNVTYQLGIGALRSPDPTCHLNLWIAVDFDRATGMFWIYLANWHVRTRVPFPTTSYMSVSEINDEFRRSLDSMMDVRQNPTTMPAPFELLSAKVMPNGDLDIYVAPLA